MSKFKKGDYVMIRKDIPLYCEIVDGRPCKSYYPIKNWIKNAGSVVIIDDEIMSVESGEREYYSVFDPITRTKINGLWHDKQLVKATDDQIGEIILKTAGHIIRDGMSTKEALDQLVNETDAYKRITKIAKETKSALHAIDHGKDANEHFKKIANLASGEIQTLSKRLTDWLRRDCHKTWVLACTAMACFTGAIFLNSCMCFGIALFAMILIVITA